MGNQVNIPKLRFPEFYGEWENKNGNEVFNTITDKNHNSDLPILAITQEYGAVPRDMINYQISVTEKSVDSYKIVRKGDFIISLRSFQGGIEYSEYEGICSPAYIILKSKIEIIDLFFKYYLKTDRYIVELNRKLEGIRDGKMISYSYFSDIKLPYPSLPEQQKIATFLTAVDDKLQALKKKKSLLDQYKKGLMQKIFSQELRFKDDDGNEFPQWEVKKLGEIFNSEKGKGISKNKIVDNGKYECVLYGELYTRYKEVIFEIVSKTNELDGTNSKKGDLLIPSSTTTTGIDLANVTALNKDNVLLGGDITILRSIEKINNVFYAYYLSNYKKEEIASYAQGSTIVHLYYSHIKDMIIDLPSLPEQTKIANFLSSIDEKINLVSGQIGKMEVWKKGLLQKMFV